MFAREIKYGSTDKSVKLRIFDSSGAPLTSVTFATAGLALFYWRDGGSPVSITPADLANLSAAHIDGGIKAASAGYYRLDVPDAAWETGTGEVQIGGTLTEAVIVGPSIKLVEWEQDEVNEEVFTG